MENPNGMSVFTCKEGWEGLWYSGGVRKSLYGKDSFPLTLTANGLVGELRCLWWPLTDADRSGAPNEGVKAAVRAVSKDRLVRPKGIF